MRSTNLAETNTDLPNTPENVQDLLAQVGFICLGCTNRDCGGSENEMLHCKSIHDQFGWKIDLLQHALAIDEYVY